jgi:hypothetical protein
MLPIKPALRDFPSDSVRQQFDKVFSGSRSIPTSPKIDELQKRHKALHAKMGSQVDTQADWG